LESCHGVSVELPLFRSTRFERLDRLVALSHNALQPNYPVVCIIDALLDRRNVCRGKIGLRCGWWWR
jgi:galactokinase